MIRSGNLVRGAARESRPALTQAMIKAREDAGLLQRELAELMMTTQSSIAAIESGRELPLLSTLEKWAEVTGHKLEIRFV
jgi:transcriptional regulator with XRE-family HTH domain